MAASKTLSPEQRTERARNAANTRQSADYLIAKIVELAPEFTDEQLTQLRPLIAAVQAAQGEAA